MYKNVVVIIGKICAGKSTLAKQIQNLVPNSMIISFGRYLKYYCDENTIDYKNNRKILQDLGQMFIQEDADNFLKKTIAYNQPRDNQMLIFEGVRHVEIFESIKNVSIIFKPIFIEESSIIRYQRFINRKNEIDDKISFDEFLYQNNHKVELEINALKKSCKLIITPSSMSNLELELISFLN